jgi:hypothetical protein
MTLKRLTSPSGMFGAYLTDGRRRNASTAINALSNTLFPRSSYRLDEPYAMNSFVDFTKIWNTTTALCNLAQHRYMQPRLHRLDRLMIAREI